VFGEFRRLMARKCTFSGQRVALTRVRATITQTGV
jgi:hypothetical protein